MPAQQRPMTYDRLKSSKKPATTSIRIALDTEVQDEYEEAKSQKEIAEMMAKADGDNAQYVHDLEQANERYRQAREALLQKSIRFKLRAVGRKKYDSLVLAHPVTPANIEELKRQAGEDADASQLPWNPDTFPPALVAASLVEPELTAEQVQDLFDSDEWSGPEVMQIFNAALILNTQNRVVDLGKD